MRKKSRWLLNHETGHYVIGCLAALEFKKRVEENGAVLSEQYANEIKEIF